MSYGFSSQRRGFLAGLAALPWLIPGAARALGKVGEAPVTVPIALDDDRLWTTVQFGSGPEMIGLFDTGSHFDIVASSIAQQTRMRSLRPSELNGLGGSEASRLLQADQVRVGRAFTFAHLWSQSSNLLDEMPYKYLFGIYTLAANHAELDLQRMEWRFHLSGPELRKYSDAQGEQAPYQPVADSYVWNGWLNEVCLPCALGGVTGRMLVDTGSPTNFVVNGAMTKRMGLWDSGQPYAPWRIRGFGGKRAQTRLYRVDHAELPTVALKAPLVMLTDPGKGDQAMQDYDGLIGMRALRRCNILFDKDARQLWLRPHGGAELPDLRYPYSGLWLERVKDRIVIEEVGIGSPAAAAGLQAGDTIVNADWSSLVKSINGPAGSNLSLETERAGHRSRVDITLKPYL